MSTPKPRVAVVGLGQVGGSVALALQQADVASSVVGHDKEPTVNKQAKRVGVVDKADWNLISACEEADLVVLAIPLEGIEETLKALASYLRPGCVVMDTATLKQPVLAWAGQYLPETVHFVGSNPVPASPGEMQRGLESARADLFQGGIFCLTPSVTADPKAVKLATDLITVLGAKPIFFDAAEHDGLMGAVDHLPPVLALALIEMASSQSTWRELRKVAGTNFELGTFMPQVEATEYADLILSNRDNVLRWLDAYASTLASIRQAIDAGDAEGLAERFASALQERHSWTVDRARGSWEGVGPELPDRPNMFVDTFLGGLGRRRRPKDE